MLSPSSSMQLFSRMWQDFSASSVPPIDFRHPGALSSCFAVSDFAAASMGIAGWRHIGFQPAPGRIIVQPSSFGFH